MHLPRLASTLALLCLSLSARALAPNEIFSQFGQAVAVLEVIGDHGQAIGSYSATVVAANRLVTSCDVIEMAEKLRISSASGDFEAKVVARDRDRNLCLISAPGLAARRIVEFSNPPAVGTRVFAISNALGLGIGISEGLVAGIRHYPTGDYIQFSAPISPGSQGGALVDVNGRLVGVIDYRRRDGQNVNFASVASWIGEIDERAKANEVRLKQFDRAVALVKQENWHGLQSLASAWSASDPDALDAWRFVVVAARGRGDVEAEQRGWEALYRIDPSSTEIAIGLGRGLLAMGKAPEALDLAGKLLAARQEDASAWLFRGQAQQASGQLAGAEQSYQRAVEIDPWQIDAYHRIAALAQARGDHKTSIAVWRRLSGLGSQQLSPLIALANAYLAAAKPAQAWRTLGLVAESDANDALVWYWKGVTLARLGCPEQAIAAYRTSLDRRLANSDWAWAGIGFALAEDRRFPEAIDAFANAEKAAPKNDEWRYQRSVNLKDGGRPGEALTVIGDLVKRKPNEAKNWRQHGFVLAVLGRSAEAIPSMEKSLQIDAAQPKLWGALVETYQVAGRREDAMRAYNQLRSLDGAMAAEVYRSSILPYEERL